MTNRRLILIHSVIYATFALGLLLLPDQIWPLYGLDINDDGARFLPRHNSIFLGGIAIFGFLFLDVEEDSPPQRKVILSLIGTNVLGAALTLYAGITGIFSGFGWSDPAFFGVLAVLFSLRLRRQTGPIPPAVA